MISRLTASAALFAILATAGFAVAADAQQAAKPARTVGSASGTSAEPMPVIVLPRVEITGKRPAAR
jgi:predicted outer membrane protein